MGTTTDRNWPTSSKGMIIPYEINLKVKPTEARTAILTAIADYHKNTCIRFVPRTTEKEYINLVDGSGCSSNVGFEKDRVNTIRLSTRCWQRYGTILHEIAHSLGIYHEQSRPDRDNHLIIHWDLIRKGMEHNFKKNSAINSLGTPYDYDSMMHYSKWAFGNGRVTLETIDKSKQDVIGQRAGFSPVDIKQINLMYKCGPPICECDFGTCDRDANGKCVVFNNGWHCKQNTNICLNGRSCFQYGGFTYNLQTPKPGCN